MNELALFAGAGGGILASQIIGASTVCAVEWDAYAAGVLAQRQNDGLLPPFPIWDDVSTFDGKPWRGSVDLVSGGFPCQDISGAGKGAGIEGSRSGLWKQMLRVVGEVRPSFVFMENSTLLIQRGLAVVIGDLAEIGYGMQWICLSAAQCGAHHGRDRFWGLGYRLKMENPDSYGFQQMEQPISSRSNQQGPADSTKHTGQPGRWKGWPDEPGMGRVANGVANRVDKIRSLGNGQVPRVAAAAFSILMSRYLENQLSGGR